ncbi:MAG: type III-B CRISPR module-associated Cmr3 family protein [Candidatus Micrarchaeia archaeon]
MIMNFSIEANLITKAFFGSTRELISGAFSKTLSFPTIYTMAGTLFTQLIEQLSLNAEEIQQMVKNEELKIYGVYIKYNNEYYIPISYQIIDKVNGKLELKLELKEIKDKYGDTLVLPLSKLTKSYEMGEKDALYLINLSSGNHEIIELKIMEEERTRIGIKHPEKVVEEGFLFTTAHKDFNLQMNFCIDVLVTNKKIKKLENWVGHFGGEGTIANFKVNERTYLADKVKTEYEGYVAVSHIPIILKDNKIISNFGEIEYIVGNIESIGGWAIKNNEQKMKRIFASIKPGSFFRVKDKENKLKSDIWYLNLLKSALPINFLK